MAAAGSSGCYPRFYLIVLTKVADIPIFYSSSFLSANKLN